MTMKNSKLKTFYCVILRAQPEGSHASFFSCHPEGEARRIPCQLAEGFFADAQNDNKKVLRMTIIKSKVKIKREKRTNARVIAK